jgi:hypothetical protein
MSSSPAKSGRPTTRVKVASAATRRWTRTRSCSTATKVCTTVCPCKPYETKKDHKKHTTKIPVWNDVACQTQFPPAPPLSPSHTLAKDTILPPSLLEQHSHSASFVTRPGAATATWSLSAQYLFLHHHTTTPTYYSPHRPFTTYLTTSLLRPPVSHRQREWASSHQ